MSHLISYRTATVLSFFFVSIFAARFDGTSFSVYKEGFNPTGENLVLNPSFESGISQPDNWTPVGFLAAGF